jgi:hypothetical protein
MRQIALKVFDDSLPVNMMNQKPALHGELAPASKFAAVYHSVRMPQSASQDCDPAWHLDRMRFSFSFQNSNHRRAFLPDV